MQASPCTSLLKGQNFNLAAKAAQLCKTLFLALGFFKSHCHQRRKPRHLLAISVPVLADSIANTATNYIRVCDRQL